MKLDKSTMLLYAVTDRKWIREKTLAEEVELAIKGGVTFVQLREKELQYDEFLREAKQIRKITDRYKVPFVVNDNVKIAMECNADGVHVGQDDMAISEVRKYIGPEKILGVSVQTIEQAVEAEKAGADYIGVGDIFGTSTKFDAKKVAINILRKICEKVSIPVVAIGGISEKNMSSLAGTGIAGVAIVSAIFAEPNSTLASEKLAFLAKEIVVKNG